MRNDRAILLAAASVATFISPAVACDNEVVTGFSLNLTNAKGTSTNSTINATVSTIVADVTQVKYDSSNAYIYAAGIPTHNVGPFPGNPNTPADQNWIYRVP